MTLLSAAVLLFIFNLSLKGYSSCYGSQCSQTRGHGIRICYITVLTWYVVTYHTATMVVSVNGVANLPRRNTCRYISTTRVTRARTPRANVPPLLHMG